MNLKNAIIFDFYGTIAVGNFKLKLTSEMDKTIHILAEKYPLYIATSANSVSVSDFLKKVSLADPFIQILGSNNFPTKFESLTEISSNFEAKNCIMISDTIADLEMAKRLQMKVIGVDWGLDGHKLKKYLDPGLITSNPNELPFLVNTLTNASE